MKIYCRSKNDPNPKGLVFPTEEAANAHKSRMNLLKEEHPTGWNTPYWKCKPEEWIVTREN